MMGDGFSWDEFDTRGPAVSTFPKPPQSKIEEITEAYGEAVDAHRTACNESAKAENKYDRAYAEAWHAYEGPATTHGKAAEVAAVEEKCVWTTAIGVEKGARAHCEMLKHALMGAMSDQKFIAFGDGGR